MDRPCSQASSPWALAVVVLAVLTGCQDRGAGRPLDRGVAPVARKPLTPGGPDRLERQAKTPALKVRDTCTHPSLARPDQFRQLKGVAYAEAGGQALAMDLMVPLGKGPFPVVLLIHGGGWIAGKRDEMHHEGLMLVEQGIVAALVDYRLARGRKTNFPAAVHDLRCAVRFLRARAGKFGLDPRRVLAMGPSSGGHLAALLAAGADHEELDDRACADRDQPATVMGAVLFSAPLDLRPFMGPRVPDLIIETFLGVSPLDRPDRAALASPVTHLDADDPPFLVVHGADDPLVPLDLSRRFVWTLNKLGVPNLYVEIPGAGHGFFLFKGTPQFRRSTCTTVGFIRDMFGMPELDPRTDLLPPREGGPGAPVNPPAPTPPTGSPPQPPPGKTP